MKKFFILSIGRSGTSFLAHLLNKDPNALVYHEPCAWDRQLLFYRYSGDFSLTIGSMLEERFSKLIPKNSKYKIYGEVNPYLRYEIDWLRNKFNPVLIYLVRDGREVVRSMYTRDVLTAYDHQQSIVPKDSDPYAKNWQSMNRFQKLCWYWMHTNEFLLSKFDDFARFEDLIKDYEYFKAKILDPTGLTINYDLWKGQMEKPINITKKKGLKFRLKNLLLSESMELIEPIPHWKNWDKEMTDQFLKICGETMGKLKYG